MRGLARCCSCLLLFCVPQAVFADDSQAVVRVGTTALTLADLQARLRDVPRYQLDSLGSTPDEIKRAFVDRLIVPELLFSEEARRRKLEQTLPARIAAREVLRGALEHALREELRDKQPVSDEDVARYYDQHRSEYEKPARLRLFRIRTKTQSEAEKVLAEARNAGLVEWRQLARKHSTDAATRERGGDLGFVHPDGDTDVPRVRVQASLYEAALQVEDGQFVPRPVSEGEQFAVIWRRGSLEASHSSLDEQRPSIKRLLEESRVRRALDEIGHARKDVEKTNVGLLEALELPAFGTRDRNAPLRIEGKPGKSARPAVQTTSNGAR